MDPTCELARRYGSLLAAYPRRARQGHQVVVTMVTRRWSAGRYVPHGCRPDWIFQLACQAELAELVAARRIIALPALHPAAPDRRPVAHGPN